MLTKKILRLIAFTIAGLMILIAVYLLISILKSEKHNGLISTVIDQGTVSEIVSVSGSVRAPELARLNFPSSGVVSVINVKEGDVVNVGDILGSLASETLVMDRNRANAMLRATRAERDELLLGPQTEAISVSEEVVRTRKEALARVEKEQDISVEQARQLLYSTGLEAVIADQNRDVTAPTVSGTYTCQTEGQYEILFYRSGAKSGFSFQLRGIENGVFTAFDKHPGTFGDCGLYLQIEPDQRLHNTRWTIDVPNKRAPSYLANLNNYERAKESRLTAIQTAGDALLLAEKERDLLMAPIRTETLIRADARIDQAQADIDRIDSMIADRSVYAPFSGIITNVNILPGETTSLEPAFTILATEGYELVARVPEIDIANLQTSQKAEVIFDARRSETFSAEISYVSPIPSTIDGVAYFEVTLQLSETPQWLRPGMNADIDIIIKDKKEALRIPIRFINEMDVEPYVFTLVDGKIERAPIEIVFVGNDGFVAIEGLSVGTKLVIP